MFTLTTRRKCFFIKSKCWSFWFKLKRKLIFPHVVMACFSTGGRSSLFDSAHAPFSCFHRHVETLQREWIRGCIVNTFLLLFLSFSLNHTLRVGNTFRKQWGSGITATTAIAVFKTTCTTERSTSTVSNTTEQRNPGLTISEVTLLSDYIQTNALRYTFENIKHVFKYISDAATILKEERAKEPCRKFLQTGTILRRN